MNFFIRYLVIICSNFLFTTFFLGASLLSIYFNASFFATIGGFLPQGNLADVTYLKSLPLLSFVLPTTEVIKQVVVEGQLVNKAFHYMPNSQLSVLCVGLLFDLVKCFSSMLRNAQLAKKDFDGAARWKVKSTVLFVVSIFATTGSFYYAAVDSNNKKIILEETILKIEALTVSLKEDKDIMQGNIARGIVTATETISGARLDKDKQALQALEEKRDSLLIHESNPISNTFLAALIGLSVAFVLEWVIKLTLLSLTFTKTESLHKEKIVKQKTSFVKNVQFASVALKAHIEALSSKLADHPFQKMALVTEPSMVAIKSQTASVKPLKNIAKKTQSNTKSSNKIPLETPTIPTKQKQSKALNNNSAMKETTKAPAKKKAAQASCNNSEQGEWLSNKLKQKNKSTIEQIKVPKLPLDRLITVGNFDLASANTEMKTRKSITRKRRENSIL